MLLTSLNSDSALARLTAVHQLTHGRLLLSTSLDLRRAGDFAQAVYREQESGRQSALDFVGSHRIALAEAEKALDRERSQNAGTGESLISTSIEDLYRSKALMSGGCCATWSADDGLKKALAADRSGTPTLPLLTCTCDRRANKTDLGCSRRLGLCSAQMFRDRLPRAILMPPMG